MGLSFIYKSTTYTEDQVGAFGGKVWWQNLRIFHGLMYLLIFYLLYSGKLNISIKLLIFDLLVGISMFINKYFLNY